MKFSKAKVDDEGKEPKRDIAVPVFGYKNHASIDQRHGFIRGWMATNAAGYDGAQLRNVVRRPSTGSKVWADTAIGRRRTGPGLTGSASSPTSITRSRGDG